ncbi:AarF/ABC1/UbiB kinase family protein [Conexibacter sp. W3-3-2]|uniref:ABC1 kinase family protein n=1 Tax=Conexibacter sp. W3-3-2 TaxID=2675227 RepID=UPI0012B7D521|nr:AarF/ABC1/UbiB kinase family protein [Conexibacter sp. W3-3-2]MTD42975.1 AarF/ABC1/UbiB kinase family protein [Conexibacter sp. W3-3-2]
MADRTPTSRFGRSARIGGLVAGQGARVAGGKLLDKARGDESRERAQRKRTAAVVEQVVVQLGSMKGAAMKFGQVLSTIDLPGLEQEDSERIKARLAELRDNAPKVEFSKMEKLMAAEWGQPVDKVLRELDREPIAAASIGQVYRGVTHDGDEVAIKVQYPGIAEAVDADLRNMKILLPLIGRLAPGLDTNAVAEELRERVTEELDYELEAQNHRRMARAWRGHPFVRIPAVDTSLSTRRVLVTEMIQGGQPFSAVKELPEADRDAFAEMVFRFFYGCATRLDLVCGDPHPGNFLRLPDGTVAFFDFGMMRQLPAGYSKRESVIFSAVRDEDAAGVARGLRDLGYLPDSFDFPDELVYEHMRRTGAWMFDWEPPVRLSGESAHRLMDDVLAIGGEWRSMVRGFDMPPEALLMRRMENILFGVACDLRAAADWGALWAEFFLDEPYDTEIGRLEREWALDRVA